MERPRPVRSLRALLAAAGLCMAACAGNGAPLEGRATPPPEVRHAPSAVVAAAPTAPSAPDRAPVEVQGISAPASSETREPDDLLVVGDELRIVVVGQVDLTTQLPVPPRGDIELPVIGTLKLLGRTVQQIGDELRERLRTSKYLVAPEVACSVVRFAPRQVFVVEGVERPQAYPLPPGGVLHLTQAIALAGGLSDGADPSHVTILRRPLEGPPQKLLVDLRAILDGDRVDLDPRLLADDTILVRDVKQGEVQVFVTGKVRSPGSFHFPPREGLTFLQAIVLAGGLDKYARPAGAALLRRTPTGRTTVAVDLERILAGELERDLPLQSGDVVFIPESFF